MDIKYLTYILTIARERNLHRAAEKLYLSQPSLSQYLTKLEAELGTPLFERKSKELVLTEAGRLYVETAQTVVNLRNKLYRDIANLSYQSHLSIATTSQWGIRLISQVIPVFKTNHPGVMIEITESFFPSMSFRLKRREVDICLASVARPELDYQVELLGMEEIFMAVSADHPFTMEHDPESTLISADLLVHSLGTDTFLLTTKGSSSQILIESLFQSIQFHQKIFGYFDNINTILHLVAKGAGISFVPASCRQQEANITYYSLEPKICRQHIIAYRQDLVLTPAIQDLLKTIHHYYKYPAAE